MKQKIKFLLTTVIMLVSAMTSEAQTSVASIGNTDYGTIQAAIDAVNDGETIKLLADIKERITFNKSGATVTFDLNGHTIDGNQQGTVLTIQNGTFMLDDSSTGKTGAITGGTQGVSVSGSSTFKMNDGKIEGNIGGVNGAAAAVNSGATFEMTGGTIQYNSTTSYTGGILLNGGSNFIMSGGVIQYNNGGDNGYGGLGIAGVQPKFSGTAVVKGNVMGGTLTKTETGYTLTGGTPCDVRNTSATVKIEVAGALLEGAEIGVYNYSGANAFTTGYSTYHADDAADKFFFSDAAQYEIEKTESGELVFVNHKHHFNYVVDGATITATCQKEICPLEDHTATLTISATNTGATLAGSTTVFTPLPEIRYYKTQDADTRGEALDPITTAPTTGGLYWAEFTIEEATAHVVYEIVPVASIGEVGYGLLPNAIAAASDGETIKLLTDITGCFAYNRSDVAITLDLNGHTMDGDKKGVVLTIQNGSLTLDDSSTGKTGVITGGKTTGNGGGVSITGGTFTLKNGTIEGNSANNGGGVSYTGGTFNMIGGTIQYNEGNGNTGGVLVTGNDFNMSSGTIQYNVGVNFGGIGIGSNGPLNFSGTAVVKDNVIKSKTNGMITKTDSGYTLAEGGTPCDVKHASANGLKLNISGELQSGAQIGVFNNGQTGAFTTGYATNNASSEAQAFFFSNDLTKKIAKDESGELVFAAFTADDVIAMINALPAAQDVTTGDKKAIVAARTAYDSLTDELKELFPADVLAKLTADEAALTAAFVAAAKAVLSSDIEDAEWYYNSIKDREAEVAATLLGAINTAKSVIENAEVTELLCLQLEKLPLIAEHALEMVSF